jgi:hypothetical protein
VSAGNPCWARAELMAATTAVAIEAAAVDPSPRGDGGGGAGFGGRGGGAVVARGTGVVLDAEADGVLAGRPSGRVVFAGPRGLTRKEGARVDGGPIRDEPVTGAAAMGAAQPAQAGRGCGLACSPTRRPLPWLLQQERWRRSRQPSTGFQPSTDADVDAAHRPDLLTTSAHNHGRDDV